jgi:glycogen operon protein
MTDEAWNAPSVRSIGVLMIGNALEEVDERGRQVRGDTLLILLNAHPDAVPFALPTITDGTVWVRTIDTIAPYVEECRFAGGESYSLQGRTMAVFVLRNEQRRSSDDRRALVNRAEKR